MRPGDVLEDRFEIASSAGAGAMGVVYRGRDRLTGEDVAIKVMHPGEDSHAGRFAREARALASLVHPAIVRYVAHGTTAAGEMYLVMEWVEGEVLSRRLARGPLELGEALALAQRLAQALGAAHARRVVHRDLKPANVILVGGRLDQAKVIDFGLVRFGLLETRITMEGVLVGTPAYMAPEQADGVGAVDARSDVYALGCVLFRALTGRTPHVADDLRALLAKVLLEPTPALVQLRPDVPPALDRLVARMLAKDADARPADAGAVAEELAAIDLATLGDETAVEGASEASRGGLTASERVIVSVAMALPRGGTASVIEPIRDALGQAAEVMPLADGALLVVVRAPAGAGEQAAGAARAALRMRAHLPDAPIVLATGRGVRGERVPVGEAIERAADLLRAEAARPAALHREPRPVRIDDVTGGLLDSRFDVREKDGELSLLTEREGVAPTRTLLGRPTPCVGRELDLATLAGTYEQCVAEPIARAVLVTAPAGVGKSRLRYEFLRQIEARPRAPLVLIGRGESTRAGAPFGLLARALRRWSGVREGEPADVQRARLARAIGDRVRSDARGVTRFLGEACGVPSIDDADPHLRAARRDPLLMGDRIRRASEELFAGLCEAGPVVLVLEDLHWGDLPTVQLVDALLRNLAERPLFVLALARPEIGDTFPRLWAERNVKPLPLEPLTRRASERLVREVLGDAADAATAARIVTLGAGNAFYLEELIRAVAQGAGTGLPETVLAMVEARLQALEPQARRLLRAASVFGEAFWEGGVAALLGGDDAGDEERRLDVRGWIDVLAAREIITPRAEARFPGERELVFRHALVREAAYAMLTDADRSRGHALAGEWLERAGETEALALAEHFDAGRDARRAAIWFARAAEHALTAGDFAQAIARADLALARGADAALPGAIHMCRGEACHWMSDNEGAFAAFARADALLDAGDPHWWRTLGLWTMSLATAGRVDECRALGARMLDAWPRRADFVEATGGVCRAALALVATGQLEDSARLVSVAQAAIDTEGIQAPPEITARLHRVLGIRATFDGHLGDALREIEAAAACLEAAGDARRACVERSTYGWALVHSGRADEGERWLLESRAVGKRLGISKIVSNCDHNLGAAKIARGDYTAARAAEEAAIAVFRETGDRRLEGASMIYLALALKGCAELEAAEREALASTEVLAGVPSARAHALAVLADVRLARGDVGRALEAATEARAILEHVGGLEEGEIFLRTVHALALHRSGDAAAAERAIAETRDRVLARAATIDAAARAAFLEKVPENARALELARTWLEV